jgi:hypothetical protein
MALFRLGPFTRHAPSEPVVERHHHSTGPGDGALIDSTSDLSYSL